MRKRKVAYFILIVFIFIFFVLSAFKLLEFFRIKRVYIVTDMPEISGLYEINGTNILTINEDKISTKLLEKNYLFKSVSVKKIYPDSLLIIPEERRAFARIKYADKDLLIDKDAFTLLPDALSQQVDKPLITVVNIPLTLRGKADWRIGRALTLFDKSQSFKLGLDRIHIDGNFSYFRSYTNEGTEIIIPSDGDMYKIAASLQIIIGRFRIEGKNIAKIDLQFEKPIIILDSGEKVFSL